MASKHENSRDVSGSDKSARKSGQISLSPQTDRAIDAMFKIAPSEVKRIVSTRPGKKRTK
jgi:hypothetical protein